jgi:hypothetical protein
MSMDYQIINGLTDPPASEQDKVIARVVLAGWQLRETATQVDGFGTRYQIIDPEGRWQGSKPSRFLAALVAEVMIMRHEDIVRVFPE